MCGIIGILGVEAVALPMVDSLKLMEYRGYDSAGVATLEDGKLVRRRAEGKLKNLDARLAMQPLYGTSGIGHTRWATHGKATEAAAHPHATDEVAGVHNGIIENCKSLREGLEADGHTFESETDTEVGVKMVQRELDRGLSPIDAVAAVIPQLRGVYAFEFLFAEDENLLVGVQMGAPLAIGFSDDGEKVSLGSDVVALAPHASKIMYLEQGDIAVVRRTGVTVLNDGKIVSRLTQKIDPEAAKADKGPYRWFMAKEINEQPVVLQKTLSAYVDLMSGTIKPIALDFEKIKKVYILACGTSMFAALIAKHWIERDAKVTTIVEIASEFHKSDAPLEAGDLAVFISQSGETGDTLASLRFAKAAGLQIVSILNVLTSTMARESDIVLPMHVGPEIAVASTKAFMGALMVLACLAFAFAKAKSVLEDEAALVVELTSVPGLVAQVLLLDPQIEAFGRELSKFKNAFYLGRGTNYALALEGALKLKEISYIHAEGQAAGEVKHGSIALIDEHMPSVVIAPSDRWFEKTISNLQEVQARGSPIFLITDETGKGEVSVPTIATLVLSEVSGITAVFVYAAALQLIAYHAAVATGTDVDQPRNLAKSVTVQ